MTIDAALAYTAVWPCLIGGVLAFIGFGISFINDSPRIGLPMGLVGAGLVLVAVVMWIVSLWMQVTT